MRHGAEPTSRQLATVALAVIAGLTAVCYHVGEPGGIWLRIIAGLVAPLAFGLIWYFATPQGSRAGRAMGVGAVVALILAASAAFTLLLGPVVIAALPLLLVSLLARDPLLAAASVVALGAAVLADGPTRVFGTATMAPVSGPPGTLCYAALAVVLLLAAGVDRSQTRRCSRAEPPG